MNHLKISIEEIETKLFRELKNQLNNEKSTFNLYTFFEGDSLSRDDILSKLRTLYVEFKIKDEKYSRHCHLGHIESSYMGKDHFDYEINYNIFIDTIIEHYKLQVIEPCSADEFFGLACKDFLISHFEDISSVNILLEAQKVQNSKEFKKRMLEIMKTNLVWYKKKADGGGTGIDKDGFKSFYTGSLYVNSFKIEACMYDCVAKYKGISIKSKSFRKNNYWEVLYEYLLVESGKGIQTSMFDFM